MSVKQFADLDHQGQIRVRNLPDPIDSREPATKNYVDTHLGAYAPPQTPPAVGFNSFQDSSGETWVSQDGSPWRKARDALITRRYRSAAYTIPGTWTTFDADTARLPTDTYHLWDATNHWFAPPLRGMYELVWAAGFTSTSADQWAEVSCASPAGAAVLNPCRAYSSSAGQVLFCRTSSVFRITAASSIAMVLIGTAGLAGQTGTYGNEATLRWIAEYS